MRITKFLAFALATLSFAACESNEDPAPNPNPQPNPEPEKGTLVLNAAKDSYEVGQEISFTATIDEEDVTANAVIYNADSNTEVSNPYTAESEGEMHFYAKYNDIQSSTIKVTIVAAEPKPAPDAFQHHVLLVDHTGNQCPNCPKMIRGLKLLAETEYHSRYHEVESHTYTSSDPAYCSDANLVTDLYPGVTGYPNLTYNLHYPTVTSATSWDQTTAKRIQGEIDKLWKPLGADAGAKVTVSEVSGGSITVDIEVMANVAQKYRVAAWVLEDNIYAYQSGRQSDEGWMDYHNNCVRSVQAGKRSSMDLSGDDLGDIDVKGTATKQFNIDIDGSWNSENLKVLVLITAPNAEYGGHYEIVNTVLCPVGESVDYEYMVVE